MTQDVQPLTWQKRTNIEEHMQFFSKINEIIDNLAPTVEEAEQAIAQATAAVADANAAIATANAASAAADAAALQAQTAAGTVAGYNTRLTAVEGEANTNAANITALQGRMGTAEGKITAIEGREADYLKKTGAAQTVTSQIMVPTTATGTRDTQIANGTRIQNDLDAYAAMVRTTGNQNIAGSKTFGARITGSISMLSNTNINNRTVKVGIASGTGAYKYGSAFYIVIVRNDIYVVSMSSSSSAPIHDSIYVFSLKSGTVVTPSDLEWKLGYYIDDDSNIFITITGPNANRITWVHFLGGSESGTKPLAINPTANETVPTDDVTTFW